MPRPFLLTGAAGVVGQSLVETYEPGRLIGLVRASSRGWTCELEVLHGDVTAPRLGLDATDYRHLAGRIGGVIHSAAITSFATSTTDMFRVNADGTAHALRLAEDSGVPFHCVSTIYVRDRATGAPAGRSRSYRESKQAAEEITRGAAVPWSILRPSVIIGDSRTGSIARFQGVYAAIKILMTGTAHIVPVAPGSRIDYLPRDYVASWIKALIDARQLGEHWITAADRALTIEQFVDRCHAFASKLGRTMPRPKLVDSELVHRLIMPAFGDELDADLRMRLELFTDVLSSLATDRALPGLDVAVSGQPDLPDLVACLDVALQFWASRITLPEACE